MKARGMGKLSLAITSTVAGLLGAALLPTSAKAGPINLGAAGDFAVLGINGGTVTINDSNPSTSIITGNVGIAGTESGVLDKVTIDGNLQIDQHAGSVTLGANFQIGTGFSVEHGQNLAQATSDANTLSASYAALPHQTNLGNVTSSLNLVGTGGTDVYSLSGLSYNSDVLTLTGNANDMFIFNDSGNFSFAQSQIVLNGINPDQVLFNFTGSDNGHLSVEIFKSSSVFEGIILGPDRTIRYHNDGVFDGEIIGQNVTIDSGASLQGLPPPGTVVPLPKSLWAGLVSLGFIAAGTSLRYRRLAVTSK